MSISLQFSSEDKVFYGKLPGIEDLVNFEGVEDHLERYGEIPGADTGENG